MYSIISYTVKVNSVVEDAYLEGFTCEVMHNQKQRAQQNLEP